MLLTAGLFWCSLIFWAEINALPHPKHNSFAHTQVSRSVEVRVTEEDKAIIERKPNNIIIT